MKGYELLQEMEQIDPGYVLEAAGDPPAPRKRRWAPWGAAAACLCVVLLLALWGGRPQEGNRFSVTAYALEAGDPAQPLEASRLVEAQDVIGSYFDGETLYINLCLKYEGENLQSVDFIAKEGSFAKQIIGDPRAGENPPQLYVGADSRLAVYGDVFEPIGDTLTLRDQTDLDGVLLFWCGPAEDTMDHPDSIGIKAVATFRDGQTQAADLSVDLTGSTGMGIAGCGKTSEEDIARWNAQFDYYTTLPLEDCELLEDSVEDVTGKEVYEARIGTGISFLRDFDMLEFDENGVYRSGYGEDGGEVYMPVLKKEEGRLYGMVYRVPEELRYKD